MQLLATRAATVSTEPAYTIFMGSLPGTWDETIPLAGKVADFVVVARRKRDTWYRADLNDWTSRDLVLDINFPGSKPYRAEICSDGINAGKAASDYALRGETIKGSRHGRSIWLRVAVTLQYLL